MAVIRICHNKENPFVQLNKKALWDQRLSLRAVGLWARCLSKPNNWNFRIHALIKLCKEGRNAVYTAINELIDNGYALRIHTPLRAANGDFKGTRLDYVFFEFSLTAKEKEDYEKEYIAYFGNPQNQHTDDERLSEENDHVVDSRGPHNADPHNADPHNPPYTNIESTKKKEEEEEAPPRSPPKKEEEEKRGADAPCIYNLGLSSSKKGEERLGACEAAPVTSSTRGHTPVHEPPPDIPPPKIQKHRHPPGPKIEVREAVTMTEAEYANVLERLGPPMVNCMLDILSVYKLSSGAEYHSDAALFKEGSWLLEKARAKLEAAGTAAAAKKSLLSSLGDRLLGRYTYELKFGNIVFYSSNGFEVGRFSVDSERDIERWLQDKGL